MTAAAKTVYSRVGFVVCHAGKLSVTTAPDLSNSRAKAIEHFVLFSTGAIYGDKDKKEKWDAAKKRGFKVVVARVKWELAQ